MAQLSDDFNRADENLTAGPWTVSAGSWIVFSNEAFGPDTGGTEFARHTGSLDSPNQRVTARYEGGTGGLFVRASSDLQSCYYVSIFSGAVQAITRREGGSGTPIILDTVSVSVGQTIYIEADGTTIRAGVVGVGEISVTDSNVTTGPHAGLVSDNAINLDDFVAADIAAPSAVPLPGPGINLARPGGFIKPWAGVAASEIVADTSAPGGDTPGAGIADQPEVTVAPNAGDAAATGTAFQPTVVTGTLAPAGHAAATGTANQPAAHIAPEPGVAAATGTAPQPEATIGAKPGPAEATGTGNQATVQTAAFTNAPAGLAAATGTANPASTTIRPNAGLPAATGTASQPAIRVGAPAGLAVATGSAAAVKAGVSPAAGLAATIGAAFGASTKVNPTAGLAVVLAEAPQAGTFTGGIPVPAGIPVALTETSHHADIDGPVHSATVREGHVAAVTESSSQVTVVEGNSVEVG